MHIILIHYHLKTGGVTTVIENQVKALTASKQHNVTIITGYCKPDSSLHSLECELIIEPSFNYLESDISRCEYNALETKLSGTIASHLTEKSIIYIHNSNMCRNPVLTYVIYKAIKDGLPAIHHCHDFAEDRPKNLDFFFSISRHFSYKSTQEVFYPRENNCHFVTINSKDQQRLAQIGIPKQQRSIIENPIEVNFTPGASSKRKLCKSLGIPLESKIITYPVRAIKRKNIGECILFSALFPQYVWCITQPPNTADDMIEYREWKKLCQELKLPVLFEVGEAVDFKQLIANSHFCVTTSIQEGFGLAFLEPWLFNTPVIGRNIEMVTDDFIQKVEFPLLYNSINTIVNNRLQDFKELSHREKTAFITKVKNCSDMRERIFHNNPWLDSLLTEIPTSTVEKNKKAIECNYSVSSFNAKSTEICYNLLRRS